MELRSGTQFPRNEKIKNILNKTAEEKREELRKFESIKSKTMRGSKLQKELILKTLQH